MNRSTHAQPQPRRNVDFHLTLSEGDRELADRLARRMGCSRTEAISRALHLLDIVQTNPTGAGAHLVNIGVAGRIPTHPDLITEAS